MVSVLVKIPGGDEQTQVGVMGELVRLVKPHPELAVAAAMELGWAVEPSRGQF